MTETLVADVDSSTESTKVLLVRAQDGVVVDQESAPHPSGTEVDPEAWWEALQISGRGLLDRASAIRIAGQQHATPNRPHATGVLRGMTSATTRENLGRAAVEALLCSLAEAVDALNIPVERLNMIGVGSRNAAVQRIAPGIFDRPVEVPAAAEQSPWVLRVKPRGR